MSVVDVVKISALGLITTVVVIGVLVLETIIILQVGKLIVVELQPLRRLHQLVAAVLEEQIVLGPLKGYTMVKPGGVIA